MPKAVAVKRFGKNQRDSMVLPAVRKDFWEFLISRHPIEEDYAPSTKNAYRWRSIRELRLVIGQFVTLHGVGVYVRSERGANSDDLEHRLRLYEAQLKEALGAREFFSVVGRNKVFFQRFKTIKSSTSANWAKMADWLHKETDALERELRHVLGYSGSSTP